jgi:hypothetical protein
MLQCIHGRVWMRYRVDISAFPTKDWGGYYAAMA